MVRLKFSFQPIKQGKPLDIQPQCVIAESKTSHSNVTQWLWIIAFIVVLSCITGGLILWKRITRIPTALKDEHQVLISDDISHASVD